jgi:hypothetical protein
MAQQERIERGLRGAPAEADEVGDGNRHHFLL